jgi:hypothetical protein
MLEAAQEYGKAMQEADANLTSWITKLLKALPQ